MLPGLLPGMEDDLGQTLAKDFAARGIKIHVGTKVQSIVASAGLASVTIAEADNSPRTLEVDRVLVSIGRGAMTGDIGLENAGVTTERGFVTVGDDMQSSAEGVYCIGDANGRCLLAHAASAQGIVAVENALGHKRVYDSPVPGAVYTFPEIGAVGLTTAQAREANLPISVGRFPIGYLGKAMAVGQTEGFVKVIRHRQSGELLGVHMLGHNATECIASAGCMLHTRASTTDLAEAIFAHPTISEAIKESAEDALGMALHLPPRKIHRITVA
jgi:dihydrolipoamide dehydrogenase